MKQQTKFKQTEIGMIPEDWEVDIWGSFIKLITYGFTCPMPTTEEGPFMITAKDLEGNKINYDSARRTSKEAFNNNLTDKSRPIKNDILLSKDGTLGRVAIVKNENLCISQSVALLRPSDKVLPQFLNYLLLAPQYQKKMESDAGGSVLKHIYITCVAKMIVAIPQLPEQSSIAKILSDLDSKIELNHKTKQNLEAIGLALFNKWFNIDNFSEDWETKPLDKIAEYLNGLPLQKYPAGEEEEYLPVIKIRELRNGLSDQTEKANLDIPEEYIVEDGDVLFSWSGTLEVEIWTNGKGALNQHLFKVSSNEYPKWFYYYWTKHFLRKFRHIAKGKATTMGHIQRHNLTESEVIIPDKKAFENMNKIMSPIVERLITINLESRNLERIRDLLLPKLMSGKLRVPVEVRA